MRRLRRLLTLPRVHEMSMLFLRNFMRRRSLSVYVYQHDSHYGQIAFRYAHYLYLANFRFWKLRLFMTSLAELTRAARNRSIAPWLFSDNSSHNKTAPSTRNVLPSWNRV